MMRLGCSNPYNASLLSRRKIAQNYPEAIDLQMLRGPLYNKDNTKVCNSFGPTNQTKQTITTKYLVHSTHRRRHMAEDLRAKLLAGLQGNKLFSHAATVATQSKPVSVKE